MGLITMFRRLQWRLRGFLHFSTATARVVAVSLCVHLVLLLADRVDYIYGHSTYGYVLLNCFALKWPLLVQGFVWQPVTYMFLHASWLHLILNMWACIVFGSALEREHGSRFFLKLYFLGGIFAAFGWLAYTALLPFLSFMAPLTGWLPSAAADFLHAGEGLAGNLQTSICIGASGGVFALLGAYFALYPKRELYVLLFFVIPLRVKARTLLWILLVMTFADWIFIQSPIAHAAHLCGGALGYYFGWRIARHARS